MRGLKRDGLNGFVLVVSKTDEADLCVVIYLLSTIGKGDFVTSFSFVVVRDVDSPPEKSVFYNSGGNLAAVLWRGDY